MPGRFLQRQRRRKRKRLPEFRFYNCRGVVFIINTTPCSLCLSSIFSSFRLVRNLSLKRIPVPNAFGIAGMTNDCIKSNSYRYYVIPAQCHSGLSGIFLVMPNKSRDSRQTGMTPKINIQFSDALPSLRRGVFISMVAN
ncbi:hypothetical protein BMS3Bbin06_02056 [bacterium BMS3Bbin06]|nr:hypothetical protein BMS3Bbin06_02056 [bacterium BMS3Bbin06]